MRAQLLPARLLHAMYPAANLRAAYVDGFKHPHDIAEDWGYRTVSSESEAFKHGARDAKEAA